MTFDFGINLACASIFKYHLYVIINKMYTNSVLLSHILLIKFQSLIYDGCLHICLDWVNIVATFSLNKARENIFCVISCFLSNVKIFHFYSFNFQLLSDKSFSISWFLSIQPFFFPCEQVFTFLILYLTKIFSNLILINELLCKYFQMIIKFKLLVHYK